MGKFRFWATLVLAAMLGAVGFILGGIIPLPLPITELQSRILYILIGILAGLVNYPRIAAWAVSTSTNLTKKVTMRLASEVAKQVGNIGFKKRSPLTMFDRIEGSSRGLTGTIIIDTSSVIDGRILDVAKCGFLCGQLIIPNFVLLELQTVADSGDTIKRARGRHGFEVLEQLKKIPSLRIKIWEKKVEGKDVDEKLVNLTKILHGKLLTCDYNLSKLVQVSGLSTLNVNDLSNALKAVALPGEIIKIKMVHSGKDKDQGIGYLPDGTMVVVRNAASKIGQEINVEINKVIQGSSGRMIFGKPA